MKKTLLMGALAVAGLSLTSCSSDPSENSISSNYLIPAYNLFTDGSGQKQPFVGIGKYNFSFLFPDNTVAASVSQMPGPDGSLIAFNTAASPFKASSVELDGENMEVISFNTNSVENNPYVSNIKCVLTQAAYAPGETQVPGYTRFMPSESQHFIVMQYNYSNWQVRSFWPDMTFEGNTRTQMPQGNFENSKTSYRIYMRRGADNAIEDKADVIMYNALFAQSMPEITIVIKDLDLKFTNMGYEISGSNITPFMVEAGQLQEAPRFIFNSMSIDVTGDLTSMNARFTVANVFTGNFTGTSIKKAN